MSDERSALLGRGDLLTSLVLIFPLFLAYQIGVLFAPAVNGADLITRPLLSAVDGDRSLYLWFQLSVALLFSIAVLIARRRRYIDFGAAPGIAIESAIYALTVGTLIIFVMQRLLGLAIGIGAVDGAVDGWADQVVLGSTAEMIIAALGAGVHEELVFRLGLFSGGATLLLRLGARPAVSLVVAAAVSSAAFSLAHHAGAHGEVFEIHAFVYRLLAGGVFAAIFYYRSLAHAVYTHTLYDVYVMLVQ